MDTIDTDYYNYNNNKGGGDDDSNYHYTEFHQSSLSTPSSRSSDDHDRSFHRHHHPYRQYNRYQNSSPGGGGENVSPPPSVPHRKRPFSHAAYPDRNNDGLDFIKLYVAEIPRTATEEEIRLLFEVYGSIIEIAIVKDPRTGQQREYCFIKYTTVEEGDRAIAALNNQYTFPGARRPMKVRYADSERDRLRSIGDHVQKLYVIGLNKQASKWEIGEIFSAYGHVEDIYIVCDEFKQSRGRGFVQFAHRDMALAAKEALNGKFIMAGCDEPLVVRFADPKKPRFGDPRNNSKFGDSVVGPRFEEPVVRRPIPLVNDSMGGNMLSDVSHQFSPKSTPSSSQSQQSGAAKSDTVCSTPIASEPADLLDCDWSEHTCPDGFKYYYNCETCESRWEKPQEYAIFEQQLQKQLEYQEQEQQDLGSCKQSHSPSTPQVPFTEEAPQIQQRQIQIR